MILIITTLILIFTALLIWSVLSFTDVQDSVYDKEMMENWNYFKWIAYGVSAIWATFVAAATWKPKTGIDKEIAENLKEISELEKHKEKMDTLAELKRRKERLFSEVNPDCKWCGEDDCLAPAYRIDGIEQYYCTNCNRWLHDGSALRKVCRNQGGDCR